jgi:hypothetical protein
MEFILTRKYVKPLPLTGKRNIMRGNTPVVELVDLVFYPMKVKNVPDDIEVSHLIIDGYIVPAANQNEKKVIKVDVGVIEVTVKPGVDGEFGTEDDEVKLSKKVIEEKIEEVTEEVVKEVIEEKKVEVKEELVGEVIEEPVIVKEEEKTEAVIEEVVKVEEKIEEKVTVEDEKPKRKIGRPKKNRAEAKPKRRVYKRKKKQD